MFDYLAINSQLSDKVYALGAKRQLEYIFRKHFGLEGPEFLYFDGFFLEIKLHEIDNCQSKANFIITYPYQHVPYFISSLTLMVIFVMSTSTENLFYLGIKMRLANINYKSNPSHTHHLSALSLETRDIKEINSIAFYIFLRVYNCELT